MHIDVQCAGKQALRPQSTAVGSTLERLCSLLRQTAPASIEVITDIDPHLPEAMVDSERLETALLYLLANAREAMPDGGDITISTENRYVDKPLKGYDQGEEGDYVTVRLPSGEMRMVFRKCYATLGEVGNEDHMNISMGKAGRMRWLGKRPKVRGVAMNPVDHPHGGGEGKSSGGRHPVSPKGVPTKGYKTRKKKKYSDGFIVNKRK